MGIYGFDLLIAGLCLLFKQITQLSYVFSFILLFLSGSVIPFENLPEIVRKIGLMLPLTQGVLLGKKNCV